MRQITDHQLTDADKQITVTVMDAPGPGGAHHHYAIEVPGVMHADVMFQNGPVDEHGVNGITQETLIAIAIDRLRCFQAGPFSCRENAIALTHLEDAMYWLHHRTRSRMARGVEGKTQP